MTEKRASTMHRQFAGQTGRSQARFSHLLMPFGLLCLSACSSSEPESGLGAVSEGEAQALDDAAEMLDARTLPPKVLPDVGSTTAAPPEDGAASPVEAND